MSRTLIYNATVWHWNDFNSFSVTNDGPLGRVETNCFVTTKNGFIVDVSKPDQSVSPFEIYDTVVNAMGRLLIPGLVGEVFKHIIVNFNCSLFSRNFLSVDSHIHVAILGESQYFVDLADCYSMVSLKDKVKAHIAKHPHLPWVIGVNWDQTNLGAFPHRRDVDEIETDKPVSYSSHVYR